MGLQRWEPTTRYIGTGEYMGDMEQGAEGDWVRAEDVDDLLARIRAAVAAERASMRETNGAVLPGAALDALLADGGA